VATHTSLTARRPGSRTAWVRRLCVCVVTLGLPAPLLAGQEEVWPPTDFARNLQAGPKSDLDKTIKDLITDYEARVAQLDHNDPLVTANLPRLRDNLLVLYREYNRPKRRYRSDHIPPARCIKWLQMDMQFTLAEGLEKGIDPDARAPGRWQAKTCWVEGTEIMGGYDLIVPRVYDPRRSWPVVISYQDDPDMNQMRQRTPYFVIRSIQQGYPRGLVAVENKTRSILKDVARDFNIDPFRIYATGFSYGGRTDLIMAWRHPHWFAAIAPVCNDLRNEQTPYVRYLKNVPTLLLHGTSDSFLKTGQVVHRHMQEARCPVEWRTYPGGHAPTEPFRKDVTVLTGFFDRHVMNPYPKMLSHIVEHKRYSRAFWVNAKLVKDAGGMEATFEVRVMADNRIAVEANDQIAALDLYLNDKLVDMNKPVVVVSGDRTLYEGMPGDKLPILLRKGRDYFARDGDTLWQDLVEIRKQVAWPYAPVRRP